MCGSPLEFGTGSSFDQGERETLLKLATAILESRLEERERLLELLRERVRQVDEVGLALKHFPPLFHEDGFGPLQRGVDTFVDELVKANDASLEMFLPTKALVGKALLMTELNVWRLAAHLCDWLFGRDEQHALRGEADHWLEGCCCTKMAEDLLQSIAIDVTLDEEDARGASKKLIRTRAVGYLTLLWESRHRYGARHFIPLLAETWQARRRLQVSVGTCLGASEAIYLVQAGCNPEFLDYFQRDNLTLDEQQAFVEFLIGLPTESVLELEREMERSKRAAVDPAEAAALMYPGARGGERAITMYEFFRARHLRAMARRLLDQKGPKRTAEEYVMTYFLERHEPLGAA